MSERTWQLAMFGHGLEHLSPATQADMERLLDLMPTLSHLTVEVGNDHIHVTRDWPSDRMEKAERLLRRIAASGSISAIVIPSVDGAPARCVTIGD